MLIALSGCAATQTAPATSKVAVPEAPCKAGLAAKPVYPADTLTGDEDLWVLGTQLWADRKARQARELELETVVEGCTKPAQ
jgi:hypothetical protein